MPLILGTNSIKDTGYNVANSLRFNDGSSDHLTRTQTNDSSNTKFNFSVWIKRCNLGASQVLYATQSGSDEARVEFNSSDQLFWYKYNGSSFQWSLQTNRVFRDVSAWYHINLKYDSTQGTSSNRLKMYINGVEETSFSQSGYPGSSENSNFFQGATAYLGCSENTAGFFDGYMSEYVILQGQALESTSFGEFDEDSPTIWKPKDVSGLTFGTNGFHLDFENASSLGADVSGNSNNFTVNNLTSIDQSTDTCTNNFATYNNLLPTIPPTFSEGNTKITQSGNSWDIAYSTIGVSSGKWYMEVKWESGSQMNPGFATSSVFELNPSFIRGTNNPSNGGAIYTMYTDGSIYKNNSASSYGSGISSGNIQMLAMDLDNNKFYWGQNGTFQNSADPANNSNGFAIDSSHQGNTWHFHISVYGSGDKLGNFGNPAFSISSGNSDANGFGNFEYTVPSGYFALCTRNLAESG